MSAGAQAIAAKPRQAPMSGFERYLTLWVALCIVAGVALGQGLPDVFQAIGRMEVAQVNLPVGLLIWVMIVPMLVKIDFGALHQVKGHQLTALGVLRRAQSIAFANIGAVDTVQEHIHLADGPSVKVHLLAEQGQVRWIFAVPFQVITSLHQHTARTYGRVIDAHTGLRFKQGD